MHDLFRRPIRPGAVIVSPARKGARQWLRVLRVDHVDAANSRISGYLPSGRRATLWGAETTREVVIIRGGLSHV